MLLTCAGCAPARAASFEQTRVPLELQSGRVVDAHVLVPTTRADRVAAVMLFGGFERGAAALELVSPSQPTVLASFEYPFEIPEIEGWIDAVRLLPAARRAIHDTFEGIGLLHAHLQARADVDPARITLVGVSFGAPFAVVSAAEYDVPGLAVIHGFGRVADVIAHSLARRWKVEERPWVRPLAWTLGHLLTLYAGVPDVDAHATRLRTDQRVLMIAAREDERVPAVATEALREGLKASAARVVFEQEAGAHLTGGEDPRIPALLDRAQTWMREEGLQ